MKWSHVCGDCQSGREGNDIAAYFGEGMQRICESIMMTSHRNEIRKGHQLAILGGPPICDKGQKGSTRNHS